MGKKRKSQNKFLGSDKPVFVPFKTIISVLRISFPVKLKVLIADTFHNRLLYRGTHGHTGNSAAQAEAFFESV